MPVHAMPVMLGVLAILAIAYRYYSAFLAAPRGCPRRFGGDAGVPVSRRPQFRPHQQVGALRPSFRGDFRGRARDRTGAGHPVRLPSRADLAGGRRLPRRRGAGHDRPGTVDPARRAEPGRTCPPRDRPARRHRRDHRHPLHHHHRSGRAGHRGCQGAWRRGDSPQGGNRAGLSSECRLSHVHGRERSAGLRRSASDHIPFRRDGR